MYNVVHCFNSKKMQSHSEDGIYIKDDEISFIERHDCGAHVGLRHNCNNRVRCQHRHPGKHGARTQCRGFVGSASQTLGQHHPGIGWMSVLAGQHMSISYSCQIAATQPNDLLNSHVPTYIHNTDAPWPNMCIWHGEITCVRCYSRCTSRRDVELWERLIRSKKWSLKHFLRYLARMTDKVTWQQKRMLHLSRNVILLVFWTDKSTNTAICMVYHSVNDRFLRYVYFIIFLVVVVLCICPLYAT